MATFTTAVDQGGAPNCALVPARQRRLFSGGYVLRRPCALASSAVSWRPKFRCRVQVGQRPRHPRRLRPSINTDAAR